MRERKRDFGRERDFGEGGGGGRSEKEGGREILGREGEGGREFHTCISQYTLTCSMNISLSPVHCGIPPINSPTSATPHSNG